MFCCGWLIIWRRVSGVSKGSPFAKIPMAELRQAWVQEFGAMPSLAARREFLVGNLAHRAQVAAEGGLSAKVEKELSELAHGAKPKKAKVRLEVKTGTRMIRVWKGEPHEVTVNAEGRYVYRGTPFPSLSAVANHITGSKWNGNMFFGLKKRPTRLQSNYE